MDSSTGSDIESQEHLSDGDEDNQNISIDISIANQEKHMQDFKTSVTPEVGMVFKSEEVAYLFYNTYAKKEGFSVRKNYLCKRRDGSIQSRTFCCNREGTRRIHSKHVTKNPRALERTNSMANIEFNVDRNKIWTMKKFEAAHNHPLASPNKTHLLRSHRKISATQRILLDELDKAQIGLSQAFDFVQVGAQGAANVGYTHLDHYNYLRTTRMRNMQTGDAQLLLEMLKDMQNDDPSFFYTMQLDDNGHIANFFWADGRSILDYSCFGDVVSFDTTFQTNKYELLFAPLLGINHHKQTVVFGAALLLDETTESFIWLFQTFMKAMSGKQPITLFTDQCAAMSKAIRIVFPSTCHRLCLWHIFQNAAKHLSHVYNSFPEFQREFKNCIYEDGIVNDFEKKWESMLSKYNVTDNSWLKDLYTFREKWAFVFRRESFCATMSTTQRSESTNKHFKKYFNRRLSLAKFIEAYHNALLKFRRKELDEDFKSRHTKPVIYTYDMPILKEAAEFYTRKLYGDFEQEFRASLPCLCENLSSAEMLYYFKVTPPNRKFEIVEFNQEDHSVKCSCKKISLLPVKN